MTSPAHPPLPEFLSRSARHGAGAGQIADVVVGAWQGIGSALAPVIGQRGVAALYQRSLHLAAAIHPFFRSLHANGAADPDLAALKRVLAQQDPQQAAAAGGALLVSFHGLVVSLIGAALTRQLLDHVWTSIFGGSAAQDPPP